MTIISYDSYINDIDKSISTRHFMQVSNLIGISLSKPYLVVCN